MQLIFQAFVLASLFTSGQASEHETEQLRRQLQVATKNYGRDHSGNLGLCEGDCNNDNECRGALVCHQREAGDGAPGCTLSEKHRNSRVDFCIAGPPSPVAVPVTAPVAVPVTAPVAPPVTAPVAPPVTAPVAPPVTAPVAPPVMAPVAPPTTPAVYISNGNTVNLGLCQGDCDTNANCAAGLKCHQRSMGEGAPTCNLGTLINSDYDFCIKDVSAPVAAPIAPVAPVPTPVAPVAPVPTPVAPVAPVPTPVAPVAPVPAPVAPVTAPVAPPTSVTVTAVLVGNNNVSNLKLCEGDCDTDGDCVAGLKCFQRGSGKAVPGCRLSQNLMNSEADFCVKK